MKRIPISLIIDDPAPVISVYHEHSKSPCTKDGRPLIPTFPNALLDTFCDIVARHGMRGKFSVIPMPGNKGDIIRGLEGAADEDVKEWIRTVQTRLLPAFTVGPEMLTHHKAVDLETGGALPMNEMEWAASQDRTTLTPYIARALSLLREAGFDPCGVTSPWAFGIEVEEEYVAAISRAVHEVSGKDTAWYFLRSLRGVADARPWVALNEGGRTVVAVPSTQTDWFWQTIDTTQNDDAYISAIADNLITADGKDGSILRVLETNGWPILIAHWQSLMSNGLGTGLRALDEVGRRITEHLSDRVEWMSFEEIMHTVAADKASYPKR